MDILETLAARGAVLTDKHFVYKSGKHGPHYINMDPVFPDVMLLRDLGAKLGAGYRHGSDFAKWTGANTVVAAATGGIPLAFATALDLSLRPQEENVEPVTWAWADKVGDDFAFERAGFVEQLAGKRVLVVEDLLNTGDTVKKVVAQVRRHGGEVIGVSVVCNRGNETAVSLGVPRLEQLASVEFQAFDSWSCPLCKDHLPIVCDIGHGREYQQMNGGYSGGFVTVLS